MRYSVVIHTDDEKNFGVTVPDLPGCYAAGSSVTSALDNAQEAILIFLEDMIESGEAIPEASAVVNINDYFPNEGRALLAFVEVDTDALLGPAQRVNVTFRRGTLAIIDCRAKAHGMNRSEYLAHVGTSSMTASVSLAATNQDGQGEKTEESENHATA
jgi:predicted RNase H-like HicB family nuclease